MTGVTYDTGALIAAERGERRMWALHAGVLRSGATPTIPAGVVAEAWRGNRRQANLHRLLAACHIAPLAQADARRVGALLGRAGLADVVDASVVDGAMARGDVVLTSDVRRLRRLATAAGVALRLESV
ncbi:MAG: twitching motility protein PilT [Candidatus Dormibacteria bacterium]